MASRSWWQNKPRGFAPAVLAAGALLLHGCATVPRSARRTGDEIIVAGRGFHTGTRIVNWAERGGCNAYLREPPPKGPVPVAGSAPGQPENYRVRRLGPPPPASGTGLDLPALQAGVDQFVLHYDACGLSRICFETLQRRGLSVHFLLDVDGTIYQTLDLRECALHATTSNDRSIGIEIANIGAYPPGEAQPLVDWYQRDAAGRIWIKIPPSIHHPGLYSPNFRGRPARPGPVRGTVQNRELEQYDFTPEQYAALVKLTAELCRVFPRIACDYPRDVAGKLVRQKLPDAVLEKYHGILGHFHIQDDKVDPGPAFQWDALIAGARRALSPPATD